MAIALVETQTFGIGLSHLVEAAGDRGHRVILLTSDPSHYAYELDKVRDQVDVVDVDTADVGKMVEILRGTPGIAGVVRMAEWRSLEALAVAQALGLPHQDAAAVTLLRDKWRLRNHLYENGFSRARSVVFDPTTAYQDLISELPFPCIVKDTAGYSSLNVWLVRRPEDLPEVLAQARSADLYGALAAEPYFVGPLYSAETVAWDGETRILGVTSRSLSPEPYFREETASFPVVFPEQMREELASWLSSILSSVGYREGLTHTEFIVTTQGLEIVEINARAGGALVAEAVNRALGVNIQGALVDLALGQRPLLMDQRYVVRQGVAQVAIYAPSTGVFDGIDGVQTLADHPGAPEVYPFSNPGEMIPSTIDQRGVLAGLLAHGETAELALDNAISAASRLTVRMRVAG